MKFFMQNSIIRTIKFNAKLLFVHWKSYNKKENSLQLFQQTLILLTVLQIKMKYN